MSARGHFLDSTRALSRRASRGESPNAARGRRAISTNSIWSRRTIAIDSLQPSLRSFRSGPARTGHPQIAWLASSGH